MCNMSEYVEEIGMKIGIEIGAENTKAEVAERMLGKHMEYHEIAELTDLPIGKVMEIGKRILL